jgi:hypothetical protein
MTSGFSRLKAQRFLADKAVRRQLLLLDVLFLVAFFYCLLEVANAFAESLAQIGKLAGPKQQQRDANNQQNMQRLE